VWRGRRVVTYSAPRPCPAGGTSACRALGRHLDEFTDQAVFILPANQLAHRETLFATCFAGGSGRCLVAQLPYLFKKTASNTDKPTLSPHLLKFIGFLAGFISALTGAVGVLFNGVYLRYGLSKEEIVATRAANEICLHIVKLGLYAYFGLFTLKVLYIGVLVAIAAVTATYLMKYVLPKISINLFSKIGYGAMVLSGVLLLNSAVIRIQEAHDPNVHIVRVSKGYDATLNWDDLIYTVEFKYGEGFEFERIIPFTELDAPRQAYVNAQNIGAEKIVIEKVYSLKEIAYEAYYYKAGTQLIKKIQFN